MTRSFRFCWTLLFGFGIAVAFGASAQAQEANPVYSSRDSIIQGVRDDVRRRIRDQQRAEYRLQPEIVGEASRRAYRAKKTRASISR